LPKSKVYRNSYRKIHLLIFIIGETEKTRLDMKNTKRNQFFITNTYINKNSKDMISAVNERLAKIITLKSKYRL